MSRRLDSDSASAFSSDLDSDFDFYCDFNEISAFDYNLLSVESKAVKLADVLLLALDYYLIALTPVMVSSLNETVLRRANTAALDTIADFFTLLFFINIY